MSGAWVRKLVGCYTRPALIAGVRAFETKLRDLIMQGLCPGDGGDGDQQSALLLQNVCSWLDSLDTEAALPQKLLECRAELKVAQAQAQALAEQMSKQEADLSGAMKATIARVVEKAPEGQADALANAAMQKLNLWAEDKLAPKKKEQMQLSITICSKQKQLDEFVLASARQIFEQVHHAQPKNAWDMADLQEELAGIVAELPLEPGPELSGSQTLGDSRKHAAAESNAAMGDSAKHAAESNAAMGDSAKHAAESNAAKPGDSAKHASAESNAAKPGDSAKHASAESNAAKPGDSTKHAAAESNAAKLGDSPKHAAAESNAAKPGDSTKHAAAAAAESNAAKGASGDYDSRMEVDATYCRSDSMLSNASTLQMTPATPVKHVDVSDAEIWDIRRSILQVEAMQDAPLKTTLLKTLLQTYTNLTGSDYYSDVSAASWLK